jgi:hypothetical protein
MNRWTSEWRVDMQCKKPKKAWTQHCGRTDEAQTLSARQRARLMRSVSRNELTVLLGLHLTPRLLFPGPKESSQCAEDSRTIHCTFLEWDQMPWVWGWLSLPSLDGGAAAARITCTRCSWHLLSHATSIPCVWTTVSKPLTPAVSPLVTGFP